MPDMMDTQPRCALTPDRVPTGHIAPLFWQHGEPPERLRQEMRAMRSAGIRQCILESRPHPDWLGPGWWESLDAILDEAGRLGMRVWVFDDATYPSGRAGTLMRERHPELLKVYLARREIDARGPLAGSCFRVGAWLGADEGLVAVVAGRRADTRGTALVPGSLVDLTDRLSGGLKRRLNLAIALLHRPELLLFDEPTVGVDPQSRAFLLQAIKQLAQDGSAVIYTSHYMEEVEAIADRVVILDQGRVLTQGALAELLNASGTLLQLAVEGEEIERLIPLLSPFGKVTSQGAGVQLTLASRRSLAAVIAAVDAAGLVVSQARFGHADLEQLFMSVTHHSLRD